MNKVRKMVLFNIYRVYKLKKVYFTSWYMIKKNYKSVAIGLMMGYAIFCVVLGFVVTINVFRLSNNLPVALPILIFPFTMLIALVFVKTKKYDLAKYMISILPAYFIFAVSIYLKTQGVLENKLFYLMPRVFVTLSLMTPLIFFGLKSWRKMLIALVFLIPPVFLFDTIHHQFDIYLETLPYEHEYYPFFKVMFFFIYCIPMLSVLFFQRIGILFKDQLTKRNKTLTKERERILKLNKQLQYQANLYAVLDIISQDKPLNTILQEVLENLLSLEDLKVEQKGLIFLKDTNGNLKQVAQLNCEVLKKTCTNIAPGQCLCGKVLQNKEKLFCNSVGHDHTIRPEGMTPHGHYVIPILHHKEVIGVINVYIKQGRKKDENIIKYIEAIADILSRRILSDQRKEELKEQGEEVEMQRDSLSSMYNEITESVEYAQLLQNSLLPNQETLKQNFRDSSVLFLPKDTVSGDFYFAYKRANGIYFGVGDCTGHGIPGAFIASMSIQSVNSVIHENISEPPNIILEKLRKIAKERFNTNADNFRLEAMDAAVCTYTPEENHLCFSGGFINLMIVRNGEVIEYKADRCSVGDYIAEREFTLHKIDLQKGDTIYLASDGYTDQFGCESGNCDDLPKKFLKKRFKELLLKINDRSCDDQVTALKERLTQWKGSEEQVDDITIFIIKH